MAIRKNPKIQKAEKELEKLTKEQEEYLEELREKGRMDRLSIARAAERDGRAEGRAESQRETAKRMLEMGLEIEIIEKATGLTNKEIMAIKENKER